MAPRRGDVVNEVSRRIAQNHFESEAKAEQMMSEIVASDAFISPDFRRLSRRLLSGVFSAAVAVGLSAFACAWILQRLPDTAPRSLSALAPKVPQAPAATPRPAAAIIPHGALFDPGFSTSAARFSDARRPSVPHGILFDPGFSAGPAQFLVAQRPSAGSHFESAPVTLAEAIPAPENVPPPVIQMASPRAEETPAPPASPLADNAPLPPARPAEFALPASPPVVVRHLAQNGKGAQPAAAPPPDNRNFFEKLFGVAKPAGSTLAYASAEGGLFGGASGPSSRYDRWTAVYDVAAHTVYLPNGTRLEAHSGLGDRLDDPGHVNERNRGATPPHVYELQPREQLFHGVQALRLNPVGGGDVFGRAGLLAHSFMLGPNGDSNGCVSFRNYDAFLQAYQTGQVKRLAVVARLD
jgi:hypothetical protein